MLRSALIAIILGVTSPQALAQGGRIDRERTLYGIEVTGQDSEIAKDAERSDPKHPEFAPIATPYKFAKAKKMIPVFIEAAGVANSRVHANEDNWVPTYQIFREGGYDDAIKLEPATIEFNRMPTPEAKIANWLRPVYTALAAADLKPYVLPGGRDSGGGHVHVGGNTPADSPFYLHPNLLRNVLVYYHKHPSLLYGFSDAYDIGPESSVETFHDPKIQQAFERAIRKFDAWYHTNRDRPGVLKSGLAFLFNALNEENAALIDHDHFINLENLRLFVASYATDPERALKERSKTTVEFRAFRSPPTPEHAQAYASDLLRPILEHLSAPGYLVPFQKVDAEQFKRFWTASAVEADWQIVKQEVGINSEKMDGMIIEYADVTHSQRITIQGFAGDVFRAFSPREAMDTAFELRLDAAVHPNPPSLGVKGQSVSFEAMTIGDRRYWVAYLDTVAFKINATEFATGKIPVAPVQPGKCWRLARAVKRLFGF